MIGADTKRYNVRPIFQSAVLEGTAGQHPAVLSQGKGGSIIGCHGPDIFPLSHVTLAGLVCSHGYYCSVRLHPYSMPGTGGHSHNIRPVGHFTLTVYIGSGGHHRSVSAQSHSVVCECTDLDNVPPARGTPLGIGIVPDGHNRSITIQDGRVPVAAIHGYGSSGSRVRCGLDRNCLLRLGNGLRKECFHLLNFLLGQRVRRYDGSHRFCRGGSLPTPQFCGNFPCQQQNSQGCRYRSNLSDCAPTLLSNPFSALAAERAVLSALYPSTGRTYHLILQVISAVTAIISGLYLFVAARTNHPLHSFPFSFTE